MANGLAGITRDLVTAGKAHGILGIGGGQGTVMVTSAMQSNLSIWMQHVEPGKTVKS